MEFILSNFDLMAIKTHSHAMYVLHIKPFNCDLNLSFSRPAQKEIDLMIKQEDLVYFFNELDRIVEDTGKGNSQPAW